MRFLAMAALVAVALCMACGQQQQTPAVDSTQVVTPTIDSTVVPPVDTTTVVPPVDTTLVVDSTAVAPATTTTTTTTTTTGGI
jgi:hypothetical protein